MYIAGDRIVCIKSLDNFITEGQIYTVLEPRVFNMVSVISDNGRVVSFYNNRFRLCEYTDVNTYQPSTPEI